MQKPRAGRVPVGRPREEGERPGILKRLAGFAESLSDPGALSEPVGGPGRLRPTRSKRSGGSGVRGQGPVSPGGVYTPNPNI